MPAKKRGRFIIVSAPSGCGKTTLCQRLVSRLPRIMRAVALTTRPPRSGEKNGRDYLFVSSEEFERQKRKGNLVECSRNFGYMYGTPKKVTLSALAAGIDVVLPIDVKGAMKVKKTHPDAALIFVLPPSLADLKNRLKKRKTDSGREIARRIDVAKRELTYLSRYDYAVINDNLKRAADKLEAIVTAERCKTRT